MKAAQNILQRTRILSFQKSKLINVRCTCEPCPFHYPSICDVSEPGFHVEHHILFFLIHLTHTQIALKLQNCSKPANILIKFVLHKKKLESFPPTPTPPFQLRFLHILSLLSLQKFSVLTRWT